MYRVLLLIAIGAVLALVAVFRLPSWPTAQSTGLAVSCPGFSEPLTRAQARRELDLRRAATAAVAAGPPPAYATSEATTRSSGAGNRSTSAMASKVATPTKTASMRLGEPVGLVAMALSHSFVPGSTMLRL